MVERVNKLAGKERFSFRKFFVLFRMLFAEKSRLSFRHNLKATIVKVVSLLVLFAALIGVSYLFYYLATLFKVFAVISYVPLSVPSLLMAFLLVFGFLSLLSHLSKSLFDSPDNKILLTYPCSGSTVFLARLAVYFVHEYGRNLVVQVPLLIGYMLIMGAPFYMYFYVFLAFLFISVFEVLLASLLSIPHHLLSVFFSSHPRLRAFLVLLLFLALAAVFVYLVLLVPDSVDVFTNWGFYFREIQKIMTGYKVYALPFYALTSFAIGDLTGFAYTPFPVLSLYAFLVMLALSVLFAAFDVFVLNPYYLRLSGLGGSAKKEHGSRHAKSRRLPPSLSVVKKEFLLLRSSGGRLYSYALAFLALPFIGLALAKFFHGMELSNTGRLYVETVMLLVYLLFSLCSTSALATSFTSEGDAFLYSRSQPRSGLLFLFGKLFFPALIAMTSLLASSILYSAFYGLRATQTALFALAIILLFLGTAMVALILDYVHPASVFLEDGGNNRSERLVTVLAFFLSVLVSFLFYLYRNEEIVVSYYKLFALALVYFLVSLSFFLLKGKYERKEERA